MSADVLLSRLDGVRRSGRGRWMARCPAHDDRRPSLSIRETDDSRVILHCFAQCATEDVLAAVGLDWDALFPPRDAATCTPTRSDRRPWRARDVIDALEHELIVGLAILADVHEARPLAADTRARAGSCRERVLRFIEELRHAG